MTYSKTEIMTALREERKLLIEERKQTSNTNSFEHAFNFLRDKLQGQEKLKGGQK